MPNYKITVEEVGGSIEVTTGYVGSVSGGTPGPAGPQGPAGSGGEGGGIDPDNVGYDIIAVLGQSNGQRWARGYDANLDYSDSRVDEWGALSKIAHSTSQILKIAGVPLPLGAYHKFVITRHNDFAGFGNYISDYDAVAPTHAYWRDAFSEHVGGQRTYVSHNPPANNFGPAPASTNLAANLWYALGNSFDPTLGSNHSKQNVDGTLEYQTDLAERSGTGTGINWNGYNDLATSGNNGYTMAIMIFGSALTAAQDAQLGTAYANDYGVTLG
jgi:hypothetical protein